MSVYMYDNALLKKLKSWTEKANVHIYGVEETRRMFEIMADESGDKPITLPIISIKRRGGYTIQNPNKTPLTYDGITTLISEDGEKIVQLNAIPVHIGYQLDIYTRELKQADVYTRDLIFNIINHPTLEIVIPYNDVQFTHKGNIRLTEEVEDNSDIPERLIAGQFSRMSLNIEIDDAYLWDAKVRTTVGIEGLTIESRTNADVVVEQIS